MSVRMGILAMLAQQPSYGYLLRAEFDRRTGAPKPLNVGQVYKVLELLERDGFAVRSAQTDAEGHVFYEATEAGRASVAAWLAAPEQTDAPARSDLAVKVAIASTLPGVDLEGLLALQRQSALARLQHLSRAAIAEGAGLGPQLAADAVIFDAETELRWLDHVTDRIQAAQAEGVALDVPFDTAPPRRGRPRKPRSAAHGSAL